MPLKNKIILSVFNILTCMLVLPMILLKFCAPEAAMSVSMLLFFALNPLTSLLIGLMSGTDIKRLFWLPLLNAALFPLLFAIAIGEIVFDLYIYSAIYLAVGAVAMGISHLIAARKK